MKDKKLFFRDFFTYYDNINLSKYKYPKLKVVSDFCFYNILFDFIYYFPLTQNGVVVDKDMVTGISKLYFNCLQMLAVLYCKKKIEQNNFFVLIKNINSVLKSSHLIENRFDFDIEVFFYTIFILEMIINEINLNDFLATLKKNNLILLIKIFDTFDTFNTKTVLYLNSSESFLWRYLPLTFVKQVKNTLLFKEFLLERENWEKELE